MDNEKNQGTTKPVERREENDGTNRARNRTVMLTPEVTGQVRALLNQDRPSDSPPARDSQQGDGFAPVSGSGSLNPMTGLITRDGPREQSKPTSGGFTLQTETKQSVPTGAPIDHGVVQSARQQSVGLATDKLTRIVGFLVSYDKNPTGEVLDLRFGRWIVSSDKTSDGNFLIIKDESVSPLHAIVKITEEGEIQVLDQLSEHGTSIRHKDGDEEKLSGSMGTIDHGDKVTFGSREFHVCLIPQ